MTDEVVLLSVFSLPSNTSGLMEGWWAEVLKEEVGVELELIAAGDQGEEKLQALMAGGELPDIVVFKSRKQIEDAVRAEMLLNLDEHIDKLPNAAANAPEAMQFYRDEASYGTGNLYAIPNAVGPGEVGEDLNWGPYLRYDLYKQLGSPTIETFEDYLPVLKDMVELEPTNEDGQKTYGISLWSDWDSILMRMTSQNAPMFGVDAGSQLQATVPFMELNVATGETGSVFDEDSFYLRSLKFYFQANQMGLIDPDSLTQRFDTALEKMEQGRIMFSWFPWFHGGYNTPDHVDADEPKGFDLVVSEEAKTYWWHDNIVGREWAFGIGSATEHADKALAYIDYMFSVDGLFTLMNGPEGVLWEKDANGVPAMTEDGIAIIKNAEELPGGGTLDQGIGAVNSFGLSRAFVHPEYGIPLSYSFWPSWMGQNPSKLRQIWREDTGYDYPSQYFKGEDKYVMTQLAFTMADVMDDDLNAKVTQIGDIASSYSWQMVFASDEAEFNELYAELVTKVEGLGIQEVLDWCETAWAGAKEKAAKYE
jgi:putative aldouronate transport system substrate-binding protein